MNGTSCRPSRRTPPISSEFDSAHGLLPHPHFFHKINKLDSLELLSRKILRNLILIPLPAAPFAFPCGNSEIKSHPKHLNFIMYRPHLLELNKKDAIELSFSISLCNLSFSASFLTTFVLFRKKCEIKSHLKNLNCIKQSRPSVLTGIHIATLKFSRRNTTTTNFGDGSYALHNG